MQAIATGGPAPGKARAFLQAALVLLVLQGMGAAQAPRGYRTRVDWKIGLRYFAPRIYREIPLPSTQTALRARFVRRTPPPELKGESSPVKPEIMIFAFSRVGGPGQGAGESQESAEPATLREAMERSQRISSVQELLDKRLAMFRARPVKRYEGHLRLELKGDSRSARFAGAAGYLMHRRQSDWTYGVYGLTHEDHLERMKRVLWVMFRGMDLSEADRAREDAEAQLDRIYHGKDYRGIEKRKEIRRNLAQGWGVDDTENYLIVHHSQSEKLINRIARDVEAMRTFYAGIFPPVKPVEAVSVVRICHNRKEYLQYGGSPRSGGYWNAGTEELVLYDYYQTTKDAGHRLKGRRRTHRDSLLVLYHEAFHQYIYYAVGQIRPHDWFNEGLGDYFSGAVMKASGRGVARILPSSWRLQLARRQAREGPDFKGYIPLERLLQAKRKEFYNPRRAPLYYAAAWSFIYFLMESREATGHPRWSRIIPDYFKRLRSTYADKLEDVEDPTLKQKLAAQAVARKAAIEAVMKDLDLQELERAWRSYVARLDGSGR